MLHADVCICVMCCVCRCVREYLSSHPNTHAIHLYSGVRGMRGGMDVDSAGVASAVDGGGNCSRYDILLVHSQDVSQVESSFIRITSHDIYALTLQPTDAPSAPPSQSQSALHHVLACMSDGGADMRAASGGGYGNKENTGSFNRLDDQCCPHALLMT